MNGTENVTTATDYVTHIMNAWPALAAMFVGSFFFGLQKKIKNGYKLNSALAIIGNQIFTSLGATVIGFGTILILPLVAPDITSDVKLGIGIVSSIMGQNILNLVLVKYFGLHVVDLMNKEDMDRIYDAMDEHSRKKHLEQCPFRGDAEDDVKADSDDA